MWFLYVDFSWTSEEAYQEYFPKEGLTAASMTYILQKISFLKTNKKGNEKKNSTKDRRTIDRDRASNFKTLKMPRNGSHDSRT